MKKLLLTLILTGMPLLLHAQEPDQKTTTETFGDWQINCLEKADARLCEMKQTLVNEQGQPVAVLTGAKNNEGTLFQIALPHLQDLKQKVEIQVDDQTVASLAYSFCNRAACFVVANQDSDLFDAFKKGNAGRITTQIYNGGHRDMTFSLKGFSTALKNLPVIVPVKP